MELKELTLEQFKGKNVKADPSDIERHQAQTITDFEISKKFGVMTKALGYELATDILGANYTTANKLKEYDGSAGTISAIENIFEWRTGRDSPNDILYIAFANDGSEDRLYYWDNTNSRWQQLDDNTDIGTYTKARFYIRKDALIVGSGLAATDYPVYVKYYAIRSIFGATDNQAAGYYDYKNTLPWDTNFSATATERASGGTLAAGYYSYYAVLTYDDGQYGEVSPRLAIDASVAANSGINVKLSISNTNGDAIHRRATHITLLRQYVASDYSEGFTQTKDWLNSFVVGKIPLDNDTDELHVNYSTVGTYVSASTSLTTSVDVGISVNDIYIGCYAELWLAGSDTKYYKRITDNTATTISLADGTGLVNGYTYYINIISYWWDNGDNYECYVLDLVDALTTTVSDALNRTTRKAIEVNWKYTIFHHNRGFYAPVYLVSDAETHKNWVAVSNINGDGNYEYDVISNYINLEDFGITEITGLGRLLDFLIIFSTNDIHKLNISSGSEFSWSLEETLQNVGCIAPDSLTFIVGDEFKHNGYYYVARDGFRVYDGYKSELISLPIEDVDNYPVNVTTLSEAVGTYNDRFKQWWVSFPTDTKTFKYDLRTGEWLDTSYPDEWDEFCTTLDGELLGTDGSKIVVFDHDGGADLTDYDSTDIAPSWKSKIYDFGSPDIEKIFHEVSIRYRSNTAIQFYWYIDSGSSNQFSSNPFSAQTSMANKNVGFPIGTRGHTLELGIDLATADKATNTYLDIEEIRVRYELGKSTSFGS